MLWRQLLAWVLMQIGRGSKRYWRMLFQAWLQVDLTMYQVFLMRLLRKFRVFASVPSFPEYGRYIELCADHTNN